MRGGVCNRASPFLPFIYKGVIMNDEEKEEPKPQKESATRTIAILLMILGGIAWISGELIGVHRQEKGADTTSEFVWWLQKQKWIGPLVRVLVGAFVLSLAAHFWFGTPLLP